MKTLSVPVPEIGPTLARSLVFAAAVGALGLATWAGTRPDTAHPNSSYVESTSFSRMPEPQSDWQAMPTVYRESSSSECSAWEVSPVAMEAILQEMIRRGWKPPTQGEAFASQFTSGPAIEPLTPDDPVRVAVSPRPPPAEALEALEADGAPVAESEAAAELQNTGAPPDAAPVSDPPAAEPAPPITRPDAN